MACQERLEQCADAGPRWPGRIADCQPALIGVLLLGTLAAALPAASQGEACEACHEIEIAPAPHGAFGCTSCHADVVLESHPGEPGEPAAAQRAEELCAPCHDVAHGLRESVHAALDCADCHLRGLPWTRPRDPARF
jgi:hypothetical protein